MRSVGVDSPARGSPASPTTGQDLLVAPVDAPDGEVATVISGADRPAAPDLGLPRPDLGARPQRRRRPGLLVVDGRRGCRRDPRAERSDGHQAPRLARRHPARRGGPRSHGRPGRRHAHPARPDRRASLGFTPLVDAARCPPTAVPAIRDIAWRSPTTVSVLSASPTTSPRCARSRSTARPARSSTGGTTACADRSGCWSRRRSTAARCSPWPGAPSTSLTRPERVGARPAAGPRGRSPTRADRRSAVHRPRAAWLPSDGPCCWHGRVLDEALDLFLGSRCVGCDRPGRMLCAACRGSLSVTARASPGPRRCPPAWCRRGRARRTTAPSARSWWGTRTAASGATAACWASSSPRPCAAPARTSTPRCPWCSCRCRRVPVPVAQRGHEATAALVRTAAARLRRERRRSSSAPLVVSRGAADQAGLDAAGRAANLRHSMHCPSAGAGSRRRAAGRRRTSWSATTC